MDPVMATISDHLGINTRLYTSALEGLGYEELHRRGGADNSSMLWIAGHIAAGRGRMAGLLEAEAEFPWGDLFGRGAKPRIPSDYPSVGELLDVFGRLTEAVQRQTVKVTDERLAAPSPDRLPIEDKTVRGALGFLVYHETYHVGQMGFLRKMLGHAGLVG